MKLYKLYQHVALFVLSIYTISAQNAEDLHIYYDFYSEEVVYIKNNNEIESPVIKQGDRVFIHVKEFNDYLLSVDMTVEEKEVDTEGSFFPMGQASGLGGLFQGLSGGTMSGITGSANDAQDEFNKAPKSRGTSAALAQYQAEYSTLVSEIAQYEREINTGIEKMNVINNSRYLRGIALNEIEKVKYNTRLKPSQMKVLVEDYINTAFGNLETEDIQLNDIVSSLDLTWKFKKAQDEFSSAKKGYFESQSKLDGLGAKLLVTSRADPAVDQLLQRVKGLSESISKNNQELSLKEEQMTVAGVQGGGSESDLQILSQLKLEFEEVTKRDFVYHCPSIQAKSDQIDVELSFLNKQTNEVVKKFEQRVEVGGGWKLNAGVGLAFGKFAENPQSYEVRDSIIVADDLDEFQPMLSTFVHFYSMSAKKFSYGGSFGVGFPFLSGQDLGSVTFFLGPSLIIGKSERIILNAGIMGGQVQRLGRGLEVGDAFNSEYGIIPTTKKYELGYFLGLSFNIAGN